MRRISSILVILLHAVTATAMEADIQPTLDAEAAQAFQLNSAQDEGAFATQDLNQPVRYHGGPHRGPPHRGPGRPPHYPPHYPPPYFPPPPPPQYLFTCYARNNFGQQFFAQGFNPQFTQVTAVNICGGPYYCYPTGCL